jgi:hypothetical protein
LVFSRGRLPNNLTFTFNEMEIGIVSEFNYLGVLLLKSGNFSMAKKAQVEKATKAMFEVLKRGKIHNLSIQCQLDLFDKINFKLPKLTIFRKDIKLFLKILFSFRHYHCIVGVQYNEKFQIYI